MESAKTKKARHDVELSAEEEGFEPPVPRGTTVFKTAAFDHSAIPLCDLTPYLSAAFINFQDVSPELDRKNNGSIESTKPATNILLNISKIREHFLSNLSF